MSYSINELMLDAYQKKASDLHITVGIQPVYRIDGKLIPMGENIITPKDTEHFLSELVSESQYADFLQKGELDFSYGIEKVSRFRINAFKQRGTVSLAIRIIPTTIPKLEQLGVEPILADFVEKPQGLIIITGPTGSGKSTTLASMIDLINNTQQKHIITLEDPIEYLHHHQKSLIVQREIGVDSTNFASALRAAMRQDPDVLLVGEMRDLETISTAITAAETGHLVLASLHTTDAANTIDRIIDVFPAFQQPQIRLQLASVLIGIVSQRLLPKANNAGRALAMEVLVNTPAIANLIRSEKVYQIKNVIQTSRGFGMQTIEAAIHILVAQGKITEQVGKQAILNWYE